MKFVLSLLVLVSFHSAFAAKLCDSVFVDNLAKRYTQNKNSDLFNSSTVSLEFLEAGGNGYVYRVKDYKEEGLVYKEYIHRVIENRDFAHDTESAERNLAEDLMRFRYYELLIKKYNLNFELVDRVNAKGNVLLTRFVDGVPSHKLSSLFLEFEIPEFNRMVLELVEATFKQEAKEQGRVKSFSVEWMNSNVNTQLVKVFRNVEFAEVSQFLSELPKDHLEQLFLKFQYVIEFPNGSHKRFTVFAPNFIYSLDTASFVMVDPI